MAGDWRLSVPVLFDHALGQIVELLVDLLPRLYLVAFLAGELDRHAFLEIPAGHPRGIEAAHQLQGLEHLVFPVGLTVVVAVVGVGGSVGPHLANLFHGGHHESVVVQVADDQLGDLTLPGAHVGIHVELP